MKLRYREIDYLKVFAIFVVIVIHVLYRYRVNEALFLLWDLLHFAVGMFVFASGFLIQRKEENDPFNILSLRVLVKRWVRLLKPYYVYVVIHLLLILVLPMVFNKFSPENFLSIKYVFSTLILKGGVGDGWIPRIFFDITLVYFIERALSKWFRVNNLLYLSLGLALVGSVLFGFVEVGSIEWAVRFVPWYAVFQFGRLVYMVRGDRGKELGLLVLGLVGLGVSFGVRRYLGMEVGLFENKYPPSFYFVMYQLVLSLSFYFVFRWVGGRLGRLDGLLRWVSEHSYEFFFAHIITMDVVFKSGSFWVDLVGVLGLSVVGVWVVERVSSLNLRSLAP